MDWENQKGFPIGDLAKMFRVSVGTLRHYEKLKLLEPEYVDPSSGYRYYSARQVECLSTIRYLRALEMPLDQIRDFLQNREVETIQEMLRQQKQVVVQKQKALRAIQRKIDSRLAHIQDALSSRLETITLRTYPARRIAWLKSRLSPKTYLDLEAPIRRLEASAQESVVFLGKVGVGISRERLLAGAFEEYDRVFLLLDPEDVYHGPVEILPPDTYLTIRFRGSHSRAQGYYRRLAEHMETQGLAITGASLEITMIDEGMTSDPAKFVTEIQVPVGKGP